MHFRIISVMVMERCVCIWCLSCMRSSLFFLGNKMEEKTSVVGMRCGQEKI